VFSCGLIFTLVTGFYTLQGLFLLHILLYFTILVDFSIYSNHKIAQERVYLTLKQFWLVAHVNFGGCYFILFSKLNLKLFPTSPLMAWLILITVAVFAIVGVIGIFFSDKFTSAALYIVGGSGA
jgi:hypothetical protein